MQNANAGEECPCKSLQLVNIVIGRDGIGQVIMQKGREWPLQ
jgi:hypothetical protein